MLDDDLEPSPARECRVQWIGERSRVPQGRQNSFHAVLRQYARQFLTEAATIMMLLLVNDVIDRLVCLRNTNTERGITFLPFKRPASLFVDPSRRICFDLLDGSRKSHGGRQHKKHMDVVGSTADRDRGRTNIPCNPSDECPRAVLKVGWNMDVAIFCRENAVNAKRNAIVAHVCGI